MRTHLVVGTLVVALAATACSETKDPLASSPDVVARAASQNLTVAQMATLLGEAKVRVEVTPENGLAVATMWSDYHRMAYAAAHDDTLMSHINVAVSPTINGERVTQLLEVLRRPMRHDTATEAKYDSASRGLYAVRHILFAFPQSATPIQRDSVHRLAMDVLAKITPGNFASMAKQYSADKQSAPQGGFLGVFPKQVMNPAAAAALAALKPDGVSKLVQSQFGFDIIQRMSWADARDKYVPAFSQVVKQSNDSLASEKMANAVGLVLTDNALAASRDAMLDPSKSRKDSTVIATYNGGGKFTISEMMAWLNTMPGGQRLQVMRGMPQVPDSLATTFLRNLAMRSVLLRAADSARIDVPEGMKAELRDQFRKGVLQTWKELGVSPEQLADSAKTPAEREQLAARRVDKVIARGMMGQVQLAPIPLPIEAALDAKYAYEVSTANIQRAIESGTEIRRSMDSTRAANTLAPEGQRPARKPAVPATTPPE